MRRVCASSGLLRTCGASEGIQLPRFEGSVGVIEQKQREVQDEIMTYDWFMDAVSTGLTRLSLCSWTRDRTLQKKTIDEGTLP